MRKTNYFGVCIADSVSYDCTVNRFNPSADGPARKLGDVIVESIRYGSTPSVTIPVTFDDPDAEGVDIMASPNADFFDIAEHIGHAVDVQQAPPVSDAPKE